MKHPLKVIKNINNIHDLSFYDSIIRNYCYRMCNSELADDIVQKMCNSELADDIVQEMYIKADRAFKKGKVVDGGYIVRILKHNLIDHLRLREKTDNLGYIDYELELEDDFIENFNSKVADEILYEEMYKRIDSLDWYDKKVLELSREMSLLELSKRSKISYRSLIYSRIKIDEKIGIIRKRNKKEKDGKN